MPHSVVKPSTIWRKREPARIEAVYDRVVELPLIRIRDVTMYRAVFNVYLHPKTPPGGSPPSPEPLYYLGSLGGRRFTPRKGPAGLYLSFDASTPPAELRASLFDDFGMPKPGRAIDPFTTVSVVATVHGIVDLTDPKHLEHLQLTHADLQANWEDGQRRYRAKRGPMPKTQLLALAAHDSGVIRGIRYPSARNPKGTNLVVFPDRLQRHGPTADLLRVFDSHGMYPQELPP